MNTIAVPFKKNSSFSIFGCTGSGKTFFVYRFLKYIKYLFTQDDIPQKIVFCYSVFQKLYEQIKQEVPEVEFFQGLPTADDLEEFETSHTLLILDDLGEQLINDLNTCLLFTQGCHHRGFSVMRISQNIFEQGKFARSITINSSYIVLLKSPRDIKQINVLGSQIFDTEAKRLTETYEISTATDFGYLILDLLPFTDKNLRMRTNVFPGEDMIIYTSLTFKIEDITLQRLNGGQH